MSQSLWKGGSGNQVGGVTFSSNGNLATNACGKARRAKQALRQRDAPANPKQFRWLRGAVTGYFANRVVLTNSHALKVF
jgi:hypothetical protein